MLKKSLLTLVLSFFSIALPYSKSFAQIELIQSVPEETRLGVPGVRRTQECWLELIREARHSIDMAQFYAANERGESLEAVLHELESAAHRGVKIRILISQALLSQYEGTVNLLKSFPNTEVRITSFQRWTGGILHAKYWIVDDRIAFVGSQNFDWRAISHIHELGLKLDDTRTIDHLYRIFMSDWTRAGDDPAFLTFLNLPESSQTPAAPTSTIELVASPKSLLPRGVRYSLDALIELIDSARDSIEIQLLNYDPGTGSKKWSVIDDALRVANRRGVKVRLLVSHWNLRKRGAKDTLKSLDRLKNISVAVAEIPEHSTGYIPFARVVHSKYMVIDSRSLWLGTSNWSRGYFEESRNVELILKEAHLANQSLLVFNRLWESSYTRSIRNF